MVSREEILIDDVHVVIIRKSIRHIYIRIYPPDGRVVISAPVRISDKAISAFLRSKRSWIIKQHQKLKKIEEVKPKYYETGEYHYYGGNEYLLEVRITEKRPWVSLEGNRIIMMVKKDHGRSMREKVLYNWYRDRLKQKLPALVGKWEKIINVRVSELRLRKMKTKWGTCNVRERRIWLNLELAKYSDSILEFILVHEMVHFLERSHNKKFYKLMDKYLPDWGKRKLNMH